MVEIKSKDFGETKPVVVDEIDDDYNSKYIKKELKIK